MTSERKGGGLGGRRTIGGSFDIAGVNRALDLLRRENLYGSLTVTDGLQDLCAFFTRGGLRMLATGRPLPTLRARLVQQGRLEQSEADQITTELEAETKGGGKLVDERELLQRHGFQPHDLDQVASKLIEEVLVGCLLWEGADFELRTGEPDREVMTRRDLAALTLSIGVDKLLDNVRSKLRVVKEVRQKVPSIRAVVEPTAAGSEAAAEGKPLGKGEQGRVLTRLLRRIVDEPGSSVKHLALRTLVGEVELAQQLDALTAQGLVKLSRARADQRAELERLREMEGALDDALNQLLRQMRVARVAADTGETGRAARHMARAGGLLLQAGRGEEATKTFQEALSHAEDDLEAREGLVQSLWATGRNDEAAAHSEDLGQRYLDLNLPGRARRVLERAIGFKEETSTLQLLVTSLVKLNRGDAAAEAGERLINRLRREGKLEEARQLADELIAIGDEASAQKLARAAGVDRIKVAVLVGFALLFGIGYSFASEVNGSRDEYRETTNELGASIQGATSLEEHERALQAALTGLEPFAEGEGEIAKHAAGVRERLFAIQKDAHLARELNGLLPWRDYHDLDALKLRVDQLAGGIKSQALGAPVSRLRAQINGHVERFEDRRVELREKGNGAESPLELQALFELGRKTREEFRGLPDRLLLAHVPVRIETTPPNAQVLLDGTLTSRRTPANIRLALRGPLALELRLEGYKPLKLELLFDTLEGPVVARQLVPTEETRRTGVVHIHLKQALTRKGKLSSRYQQLSVGKDSKYFAGIELPEGFQAYVYALHEIRADAVYLTGVMVKTWNKVGGKWKASQPETITLEDKTRRQTRSLGRILHVEPLGETRGLDHADLRARVEAVVRKHVEGPW